MKYNNPSSAAKGKRGRDIDFLSVPRGWGDTQPPHIVAQHDPQRGRGVHDPRFNDVPPMRAPMRDTEPPMRDMYDPLMRDVQDPQMAQALELIREAVRDEAEDAAFYEYLIAKALAAEEKRIISGIRDDEQKHFQMFRKLYEELTGERLPYERGYDFEQPASYCAGLKKALLGEQAAVAKYRNILFTLEDREQIDAMTEIITDELRHLGLYNYLYAKNKCSD